MNLTRNIMLIPLAALLLTGCAQPPKSEYAAFAQAGSGYATAVGKLLVVAGKVQVDSSSWIVVKNKDTFGVVSEKSYRGLTDQDKKRLKIIRNLQSHAVLLGKYFDHLNSLATSDAPERTKASIEGLIASMTKLAPQLNASYPDVFKALPQLTNIAVDIKIRGALREELNKRKDVIRRQLVIQDRLLTRLRADITTALNTEAGIKEDLFVIAPLLDKKTLEKPEAWVTKRHEVIYLLPVKVAELESASKAAGNMKEAFEILLSGKDALGRINALIKDIESILAVVDAVNS
ncbi:MAG: hypothetical protein D3903_11520 [Candidatus Electrothrix sp. GM3_4]|nr:hypothetical protein [Candidatus Electrothrix sp. GM3_4]